MYSISMSLFDFIPVILFGVAAVMMLRDFYDKMSKGVFAIFATGTIDVFMAGLLKATYKLLYALNICNFEPLSQMFFPLQGIGLLLAGLAVARMTFNKKSEVAALAVLPSYKGTFIFVTFMVLGLGCMNFSLATLAKRANKKGAIILFVVSFICYVMMGYLSSKDFSQNYMNWIAELVNLMGQLTLLIGVNILHKAK